MANTIRVVDRPLQRLHTTQASAEHRCPLVDTQGVRQPRLAFDPVAHGYNREIRSVRLAGCGVLRQWAGRARAATQIVQTHDKKAIGVEWLPRSNAIVPPAGLGIVRVMIPGGVVVPAERVADQHGVAPAGVQFAVGLVDQFIAIERDAAVEFDGLVKELGLGRHQADAVARYRVGHVLVFCTSGRIG